MRSNLGSSAAGPYTGSTSAPESVVKSASRRREASNRSCQRRRPASMSFMSMSAPPGVSSPPRYLDVLVIDTRPVDRSVLVDVSVLEVLEVARGYPQRPQHIEDLPQLVVLVRAEAEVGGPQVARGALDGVTAALGDLGEHTPAVARVRAPVDVPLPLQAVDRVGHARRVHHQPFADLGQRQSALAAERPPHQGLVAGEGQLVRLEQGVELGEEDRLRTR